MYEQMIDEFHRAMGFQVGSLEDPDLVDFRVRLITEEYREFMDSLDLDLEDTVKELCDLLYVIFGFFWQFDLPVGECFAAVHESNMSKLEDGKPQRRKDGKILKGPNFKPAEPMIDKILNSPRPALRPDGLPDITVTSIEERESQYEEGLFQATCGDFSAVGTSPSKAITAVMHLMRGENLTEEMPNDRLWR